MEQWELFSAPGVAKIGRGAEFALEVDSGSLFRLAPGRRKGELS